MKIAITNNTGLRNRGCEALVVSLIDGVKRHLPGDLDFTLHTNDPVYDAWRLSGKAKVGFSLLTMTPNHPGSLGFNKFGYGTLRLFESMMPGKLAGVSVRQLSSLKQADLVLPTGGDIFTSDYHNLRKHLSSLVALNGKKAAMIAHTIGPFTASDEKYFRKTLGNLRMITVRESESFAYLQSLNLDIPVHLTADVAFTLQPTPVAESLQLVKTRYGVDMSTQPCVGLSVSEGVIRYSKLEREQYFKELTEFVDRLNRNGRFVLMVPHVMERNPNNNDQIACEELHARLKQPEMSRILSGELSASQFKGIIGQTECLLGARTHATIASMSQGIPTVSVAYSRKAYGIMNDYYGEKLGSELTIAATDLSADALSAGYQRAMANGRTDAIAAKMKDKAEENFRLLAKSCAV